MTTVACFLGGGGGGDACVPLGRLFRGPFVGLRSPSNAFARAASGAATIAAAAARATAAARARASGAASSRSSAGARTSTRGASRRARTRRGGGARGWTGPREAPRRREGCSTTRARTSRTRRGRAARGRRGTEWREPGTLIRDLERRSRRVINIGKMNPRPFKSRLQKVFFFRFDDPRLWDLKPSPSFSFRRHTMRWDLNPRPFRLRFDSHGSNGLGLDDGFERVVARASHSSSHAASFARRARRSHSARARRGRTRDVVVLDLAEPPLAPLEVSGVRQGRAQGAHPGPRRFVLGEGRGRCGGGSGGRDARAERSVVEAPDPPGPRPSASAADGRGGTGSGFGTGAGTGKGAGSGTSAAGFSPASAFAKRLGLPDRGVDHRSSPGAAARSADARRFSGAAASTAAGPARSPFAELRNAPGPRGGGARASTLAAGRRKASGGSSAPTRRSLARRDRSAAGPRPGPRRENPNGERNRRTPRGSIVRRPKKRLPGRGNPRRRRGVSLGIPGRFRARRRVRMLRRRVRMLRRRVRRLRRRVRRLRRRVRMLRRSGTAGYSLTRFG